MKSSQSSYSILSLPSYVIQQINNTPLIAQIIRDIVDSLKGKKDILLA